MNKNRNGSDFDGYRNFGPGTYVEEKDDKGNITQRKISATIFSEDPVDVYDWESDDVIREILLTSGMKLPENRQLPLLDNHTRWNGSVSVKGSVRNIKAEASGLGVGDVYFSSTANDIATLAREGHLTDLSVGYKTYAEHTVWIEPGGERMCGGKPYKNEDQKKRLAVRTSWKPYEVSTTPIGADAKAKFRSTIDKNKLNEGERKMEPEKKIDNPVEPKIDVDKIREGALKEGAEAESARILEIQTTARELNIPDEFIKDFIKNRTSAMEARTKIIQEAQRKLQAAPPGGPNITVNRDETDKFRGAAVTGLLLRSGYPAAKIDQKEREAVEKSEFRGSSMQHLARFCLEKANVRGVQFMDNATVANEILGLCSRSAQNTGDFTYVLAAAANKFLMNAYVETPTTYQAWVKMMGLDDFKQNKLVNISLFSDVDLWPEGQPPEYGKFTDKGEYITMYKYGKLFSISYEALVNDDKNAFSRIPAAMGGACARKRNVATYNLLYRGNTAGTGTGVVGPTMNEDGVAMFNLASHVNYPTGAAPAAAALAAAEAALRKIKLPAPDPTSGTQYTNASIKFLICAVAKRFLWQQILYSETVVEMSSGVNAQANPGVANPFKNAGILLISDPLIDAFSSTLWYIGADPNQVGHITMGNLNGQAGPQIRQEPSAIGAAKGISYEVMDCFAVAAEDWRGMVANVGA